GIARGGACGQPQQAVEAGGGKQQFLGLQHIEARKAAIGEDGGSLDADNEARADDGGNDLRGDACPPGTDGPEKPECNENGQRSGEGAHGREDKIGGEPAGAVVDGEHVDHGARDGEGECQCEQTRRAGADGEERGGGGGGGQDQVEIGAAVQGASEG